MLVPTDAYHAGHAVEFYASTSRAGQIHAELREPSLLKMQDGFSFLDAQLADGREYLLRPIHIIARNEITMMGLTFSA